MESLHNIPARSAHPAVRKGSNRLKNMRKKEKQKQMIDLIKKMNRRESLDPEAVIIDKFFDPDEYVRQNGEEVPRVFFTRRKPRFGGSIRARRQAGGRRWWQNGRTIKIKHGDEGLIGYERYYELWKDVKKTCWRLREYAEHNPLLSLANEIKNCYVLCKLEKVSGESSDNNCEGRVGKGKNSQHEEERAAKHLDSTINRQLMQDLNQNPTSTHFHGQCLTSGGNESLISPSKFPARFGIEDFHNHEDNRYPVGASGTVVQSVFTEAGYPAGASGDTLPHFEFALSGGPAGDTASQSEDYYKLSEHARRVLDSDEWINLSFEGFDDLRDLDVPAPGAGGNTVPPSVDATGAINVSLDGPYDFQDFTDYHFP